MIYLFIGDNSSDLVPRLWNACHRWSSTRHHACSQRGQAPQFSRASWPPSVIPLSLLASCQSRMDYGKTALEYLILQIIFQVLITHIPNSDSPRLPEQIQRLCQEPRKQLATQLQKGTQWPAPILVPRSKHFRCSQLNCSFPGGQRKLLLFL